MSFMFEYIGEMAKDYIYAVTPLLVDALMERDLVHRQIAMDAVAHLTLGVAGFACEDALTHLFNHVWPNVFETSPHVIQRFPTTVPPLPLPDTHSIWIPGSSSPVKACGFPSVRKRSFSTASR